MNESIITAEDKVKSVGDKVKSVRESKSISIETLAERTKLSIDQIKMSENGESLSLSPLIKIAKALGVRLGTFLDNIDPKCPVVCCNKDYYEEDSNKDVKFKYYNNSTNHLAYYSLAMAKSGRYMEPFIIVINNTEGDNFTFSSHEGEEFIYCLEGVVKIMYGQEDYTLNQGDSIYYDSIVNHGIQAVNGRAKILAVVYAPV
jgi:transcriptional regulator with XRE-family HTH domain